MSIWAVVGTIGDLYVATLSDGRIVEESDLRLLAIALNRAGVPSKDVHFEWRARERMMTAGQKVSLHATIRTLECEQPGTGCRMTAGNAVTG